MAAVKQETASQNRAIHFLESYNYSDIWCIETMIKSRLELDGVFKAKLFDSDNPFKAGDIIDFKELTLVMYLDLENLLNQITMTEDEALVVEKLMLGYSFKDISEVYFAKKKYDIKRILRKVSVKIKKANDINRLEWYKKRGFIVSRKTCLKCEEEKSVTEFTRKEDSSDGYHPYCKKCRRKLDSVSFPCPNPKTGKVIYYERNNGVNL